MDRRAFIGTLAVGVLACPPAPEAQRPGKIYRIAYLGSDVWAASSKRLLDAFRQGLRELGWVEGKNIALEFHYAEGKEERFPGLAAELAGRKVDVIWSANPRAILAAKQVTTTIPIVFTVIIDPVGAGLVASLARPGGNVTGVSWDATPELAGKQLQLLKEVVPGASRITVLWNPAIPGSESFFKETLVAARALNVTLQSQEVRRPDELDRAFAGTVKERAGAVVVLGSGFTHAHRKAIADLAARHRLPAIYGNRESVDAGGLMPYGASLIDQFRRAAVFIDKILKGAKPADLPIEQPTKFELVINLKTAKALGLTIPPSLLLRADQVLE